jgi:hypothetical protein
MFIPQIAVKHGLALRSISVKGSIQTLASFQPRIAIQAQHDSMLRASLCQRLLDALTVHRVDERPFRFESRLKKRRTELRSFAGASNEGEAPQW